MYFVPPQTRHKPKLAIVADLACSALFHYLLYYCVFSADCIKTEIIVYLADKSLRHVLIVARACRKANKMMSESIFPRTLRSRRGELHLNLCYRLSYFRVRGVITRKDLMGFQMEERIHKCLHDSHQAQEMHSPSSSSGHRPSVDA